MEITIKGEAKEIAALVFAAQERQQGKKPFADILREQIKEYSTVISQISKRDIDQEAQ